MLHAPLSVKQNRMPRDVFIAWTRFYLRLPQLPHLGNAVEVKGVDYDMESCLGHHAKDQFAYLDLFGNHACSNCPSAAWAQHRRHTFLKWVFYYAAVDAGLQVEMEPSTVNLLNNQFTGEQLRHMFPKNPTAEQKQATTDLLKLIEYEFGRRREALMVPASGVALDVAEIKKGFAELYALKKSYQTKGLRIDLRIMNPITGDEWWVDVTSIHPTCKSRVAAEYKRALENQKAELDAKKQVRGQFLVGKAVEDQSALKHTMYAPLVAIAAKQKLDGKRAVVPRFFAAVCSSLGEYGQDTFKLSELITAAFKGKMFRMGDRCDDQKPAALSAAFRNKLRTSIQFAVGKGLANMLLYSGLPSSSCGKHVKEDDTF
jgi:hypothetical protein